MVFRNIIQKIIAAAAVCGTVLGVSAADKFVATKKSLARNNGSPEWLQDAKFGFYFHWGVQTLATQDIPFKSYFYPAQMYMKDHAVQKYHIKTYGDPKQVGWKDMIPKLKAEKFNAKEWVDLFIKSGARFGGAQAIHCDGVAMWDSQATPWNVKQMGPKRDILGEIIAEYRKHDMKILTTFHHGTMWRISFFNVYDYDGDLNDPKQLLLYQEPHKKSDKPTPRFMKWWRSLVDEVVDKYKPDAVWFDYGLRAMPETEKMQLFADFYNKCAANGQSGRVFHKAVGREFPLGVLDTERGRPNRIIKEGFLNDKSIGKRCWFNKTWSMENEGMNSVKELVCALVDLASKNGAMMLSVAPDKDGQVPARQREVMLGIGKWLKVNGEAIYNTRAWKIPGEGPKQDMKRVDIKKGWDNTFTSEDLRFTRSKDGKTLYVFPMARPKSELCINSIFIESDEGAEIYLLGYGKVAYELDDKQRINISVPKLDDAKFPADMPLAFRLKGFRAVVHYDMQQ